MGQDRIYRGDVQLIRTRRVHRRRGKEGAGREVRFVVMEMIVGHGDAARRRGRRRRRRWLGASRRGSSTELAGHKKAYDAARSDLFGR